VAPAVAGVVTVAAVSVHCQHVKPCCTAVARAWAAGVVVLQEAAGTNC
jgi:hypothetical protein